MKRGLLGTVLVAVCVVLGIAIVYVDAREDDAAPTITVSEEALTYQEGTGTNELLAGVKAEDKEDGDLTKEVFVEKIIPVEENKAIVYYGVLDKSQNIGTATKEVEYIASAEKNQEAGDVERPTLQLTTGAADLPVGTPFDPKTYIQGVADNVDSPEILNGTISIEGACDTAQPGVYQLTYTVRDSAGNVSDPQVLTVTVH